MAQFSTLTLDVPVRPMDAKGLMGGSPGAQLNMGWGHWACTNYIYIYITFLYNTRVCVSVCVCAFFEVFIFYPISISKFYIIHGFLGHKLFFVQNLITFLSHLHYITFGKGICTLLR